MMELTCHRLSPTQPIRFPDARRLDRSNRRQFSHGTVHHCAREARRRPDMNVVRRKEAAEQVRQLGGDRVVARRQPTQGY